MHSAKPFFDLADELGDRLDISRQPIERADTIAPPSFPFRRKDLWPADEWARMQRIWNGEEE